MLIGFHGYAKSGKDTAASAEYFNDFDKFAFAKPLKDAVSILYLFTDNQLYVNKEEIDTRYNKSPRQVLQEFGSYLRSQDTDFFCNLMKYKIQESIKKQKNIIITDVRYENEAKLIKQMGGIIIHINRDIKEKVREHESEKILPNNLIDYTIENNSTIEDLHNNIYFLLFKCR